jgi:hypothetical protein
MPKAPQKAPSVREKSSYSSSFKQKKDFNASKAQRKAKKPTQPRRFMNTAARTTENAQMMVVSDKDLVDMTNTMPGKKKKKNLVKVNPNIDLGALFS